MDQPNSSILSSSFLSQLISQKLNHSNYLTWKRQIVPFIKSHRLYGHIDDTTLAPPQYIDREVKRTVVADQGGRASTGSEIRFEYETVTENNPTYEVWLAHDQSLVAYITSTLSEEVLGGIDDDLIALELWSTLATTYSQVSEARFLQLRRQFQDIKRGMRTVLEYLNEIKSVSDQLAAIGHPVSDKDKEQQALSGLETEFDIFCTALEVLPILPSFEDLKAKLFQHEASRLDPFQQPQCLDYRDSCNARASYPSLDPSGRNGKRYSSNPSRYKHYFYCNKRGHVKSECWHNPQNKNNHIRREGKATAGAASSSSGQNVTSNIPADAQQLLRTTISKLQLKQNEQGEWYVDSGAAAHVTGDAGQGSVVMGDGSHHTISHIGNARISMGNSSIPLKNVLVVPSVKKNIISVSKLIDDTHSSVEFTSSSVYVKEICMSLKKLQRCPNNLVFQSHLSQVKLADLTPASALLKPLSFTVRKCEPLSSLSVFAHPCHQNQYFLLIHLAAHHGSSAIILAAHHAQNPSAILAATSPRHQHAALQAQYQVSGEKRPLPQLLENLDENQVLENLWEQALEWKTCNVCEEEWEVVRVDPADEGWEIDDLDASLLRERNDLVTTTTGGDVEGTTLGFPGGVGKQRRLDNEKDFNPTAKCHPNDATREVIPLARLFK
ncbi:Retrovirus-related Pol polyprotein from transposon TNT 1-94 [Nymphaea thermarum]|nr:Retrovirus-related Pol polyprotein from transposon TNT 1-94 [Nymphaea thermarum]